MCRKLPRLRSPPIEKADRQLIKKVMADERRTEEDATLQVLGWKEQDAQLQRYGPTEVSAWVAMERDRLTAAAAPKHDTMEIIVKKFLDFKVTRAAELGYSAEIYSIYLLKIAQRKGLGTAMMREVFSRLIAAGHRSASICVLRENYPAVALYTHLDAKLLFEDTLDLGGRPCPELVMGFQNLLNNPARLRATVTADSAMSY